MKKPKRRVVSWSTGNAGMPGLRQIIRHPELELVGLYAWSPNKVGRDAGEIAGLPPIGIRATNNVDELLALNADCLAYFQNARLRMSDAVNDICRFLKRGTNVATTSLLDLVSPSHAKPEIRDPVIAACEAGKSTLFASGLNPGFCMAQLPLNLLSIAGRVDSLTLQELCDMSNYQSDSVREIFGLGVSPNVEPLAIPYGIMRNWWGSEVRDLAGMVGVEIDDMTYGYEYAVADRDFTCAMGPIKKGLTAASRFTVQGMLKGRPALTYELYYRLTPEAAPHWPSPRGDGGYSFLITVAGEPNFTNELNFEVGDGNGTVPAHVVNAIPLICDAKPGILGIMEPPLYFTKDVALS